MNSARSRARSAGAGALSVLAAAILLYPASVSAAIIWRGDFNDCNFRKWHSGKTDELNLPWYWQVPPYGRPPQMSGDPAVSGYYGNGELLQLSTTITRGSRCSARARVKSNGTTQADWTGSVGTHRRTEISTQGYYMLSNVYNALPYQS